MSKPLLEFDPSKEPVAPKEAATIVIARDTENGPEIFCVERNKKTRFLGGAVVFPGGKLDASDMDDAWAALTTAPRPARDEFTEGPVMPRALAVAALRETLEEAALLIADGPVSDEDVRALRGRAATDPTAISSFLKGRGLRLDAASLHPLSRWITPEAETRRYDTRFFLAEAPPGQTGAHDMLETMASFWARPSEVLARFERAEVQVAPPTHRTLQVLSDAKSVAEMLAIAHAASLLPICPKLVMQQEALQAVLALALPGDPEHAIRERRVSGTTRYVLRGEHWRSE